MTETEPLLLTMNEARVALGGISRTTVFDLIKRGEVVRVRIGTRAFVTSKSVAEYVDRLTAAAASAS